MSGLRRWVATACGLLCVSGCAVNPVTGRPEMVLMSTEQEKKIGAEAAQMVATEMGFLDSPVLSEYVAAVGQRLAQHSPRQDVTYSFRVVEMKEPNAFALPAGHIYVSRGLLALTNSEEELAGVIGHEIGHVAARHAVQRQTRAAGLGILALPGALVGAVLAPAGNVINAPVAILGGGLLASYSRGQERQADEVGQQLSAEAGIDPIGIAVFLHALERATVGPGGEARQPGFFDSHPSTPERVAAAKARAKKSDWTPQPGVAADRAELLSKLDGLLVGDDPAEGVFQENLFLHPDMGFAIRFPGGWREINSARSAGAVAPGHDGTFVLELSGSGTDAREAANADLQKLAEERSVVVVESGPTKVGSLSAFRAHALVDTRDGTMPLEISWVAFEGTVYRLTGLAAAGRFDAYQPLFRRAAGSFRPIAQSERDSIQATRLRVVRARAGETLARLSARTGSTWTPREIAVANGLAENAALAAGQLVKVALPEPYRP